MIILQYNDNVHSAVVRCRRASTVHSDMCHTMTRRRGTADLIETTSAIHTSNPPIEMAARTQRHHRHHHLVISSTSVLSSWRPDARSESKITNKKVHTYSCGTSRNAILSETKILVSRTISNALGFQLFESVSHIVGFKGQLKSISSIGLLFEVLYVRRRPTTLRTDKLIKEYDEKLLS